MMSYILEICCGSAEDVIAAAKGGADRAELNSALFLGGLTPSLAAVRRAKKSGIPIMVMVRPRDGGFCYTDEEFETMLEDVRIFASEGVDGLVFGVLRADGTVDTERNRILVEAAGEKEKVFHRAFDVVPDWRKAIDELVELGFDRILTSGQAPSAPEGVATLGEMLPYADGRIEILPGGGIRPHNILSVLAESGCTQAHCSAGSVHIDPSCRANPKVHFGSTPDMPEDEYKITDTEKVKELVSLLKNEI